MRAESYRRRLWDFAVGQYGYVRAADAHDLEIPVVELGKLAARGQIRHVAYGLYRFDDLPPTRFDRFFEAVARVGGDAHLTGDAVLALHELGQVNPRLFAWARRGVSEPSFRNGSPSSARRCPTVT